MAIVENPNLQTIPLEIELADELADDVPVVARDPRELPGSQPVTECATCMGPKDDSPAVYFPCTHWMHESCVQGLMEATGKSFGALECPTCRTPMLASASALADEPSEADLAAMRAAAEEDGEDVQEVEEVRSDDGSDAPADRQPDIDETVAQNGGPEDTVVDVENVERVAGGPVVENSALVAEDSLVGLVAATGGRRLRGKTNLVADVRPSAKAKGKAKGKCKGTQAPTENEEKDEGEKTKAAPNAQKVKAPRGRKRKADEASLGAEGASTLQSFFGATASQSQDVPDSAVDANASEAPKETEEAAPKKRRSSSDGEKRGSEDKKGSSSEGKKSSSSESHRCSCCCSCGSRDYACARFCKVSMFFLRR